MKLYKFRRLGCIDDLTGITDIIDKGFHCNNFSNFNDMNEGVFSVNEKIDGIAFDKKMAYRICSFSKKKALNNELMWGHYANAGKGVVIEVEVKKECCRYIKEVVYKAVENHDPDDIEQVLTRKSAAWQYECEYRYLSTNSLTKTKNKVKIGKITKIYFGMPYKLLGNYRKDILPNHTTLRKYLECKKCLEDFCYQEEIEFEYHIFNYITKYKQTPT